jgi:cell division protein FtsB
MVKSKFAPIILLLTIILFFPVLVQADDDRKKGNPFKKLQKQINALKAENAAQNGYISTLRAQVAELQSGDAAALAAIFAGVSRTDDDIFFDGVNVHIRSGSGATNGNTGSGPSVNGLGNIIIGYDEIRTGDINEKTGSHNLVVGEEHNYSSYGGLVVGFRNTVSGSYATVSGGAGNTASGAESTVSGGDSNTASSSRSTVSGGAGNTASNIQSTVSGGLSNTASGSGSTVSGGSRNISIGAISTVSGGSLNIASGDFSSVSGGRDNTASGEYSSVSGGQGRSVNGVSDWRAGNLFETE